MVLQIIEYCDKRLARDEAKGVDEFQELVDLVISVLPPKPEEMLNEQEIPNETTLEQNWSFHQNLKTIAIGVSKAMSCMWSGQTLRPSVALDWLYEVLRIIVTIRKCWTVINIVKLANTGLCSIL